MKHRDFKVLALEIKSIGEKGSWIDLRVWKGP